MTRVQIDVLLLVAGVIFLLLAWMDRKFPNFSISTLDTDKCVMLGIGMILMGIIDIIFG